MRRFLLLAILLCPAVLAVAQDYSRTGPRRVAQSEVTIARTNGTTFSALLFVPTDASGPFPAISFGHGFLAPPSLYAGTMRHLASWGYVVIATKSAGELFPDHQTYADDLRLCLYWLEAQNSVPGGPLNGRIAPRWGVSGHSMGGGAGILAAADDPQIAAVAMMAPAETRPSAVAAIAHVAVPVCLIAGSEDTFTPPPRHARKMYDAANAPRVYPLIHGGFHCGFVDVPLPESVCDSGSLPRTEQLPIARGLLTAFFELYLKDDVRAWSNIWGPVGDFNRKIAIDRDAGFSLAPLHQRQRVRAGEVAAFTMRLDNRGDEPVAFRFEASGTAVLDALQPSLTAPIPPGAATTATVRLTLPAGRAPRAFGLISAYPDGEPQTRDYGILELERR